MNRFGFMVRIADVFSKKHSDFVRIIPLKNDIIGFALRNRRFYNAKPTVLPCKTVGFGMRNNRYCNVLVVR